MVMYQLCPTGSLKQPHFSSEISLKQTVAKIVHAACQKSEDNPLDFEMGPKWATDPMDGPPFPMHSPKWASGPSGIGPKWATDPPGWAADPLDRPSTPL